MLAILFIYHFLFNFLIFIFLYLCSKHEWVVYIFPTSSCQTDPCLMISHLFYSSTTTYIFCHFLIAFLIPPASRIPSGLSIHLLIFPCTDGRSSFFQCCWIFPWGLLLGLLLVLFEPIYLFIYGFMNLSSSIVYSYGRSLLGYYWNDI